MQFPDILRAMQTLDEEIQQQPLVISIMGPAGVGKSSLINALFQTDLKTDPLRPCRMELERSDVKGKFGHDLRLWKLPVLSELRKTDPIDPEQYRNCLLESDIVLYATYADNRSVRFDRDALESLLATFDHAQQIELMSKITFVFTKVDLLSPPGWILGVKSGFWQFAPLRETKHLMEEKERYYWEQFIQPFGHLIRLRTYNDNESRMPSPFLYAEETVSYDGILTRDQIEHWANRYPNHRALLNRLYDNTRIIPCSALFRYNLTRLLGVILEKLKVQSFGRLKNFVREEDLKTFDRIELAQARNYANIVVYDYDDDKVLIDISELLTTAPHEIS
jgi:hypothetical protein